MCWTADIKCFSIKFYLLNFSQESVENQRKCCDYFILSYSYYSYELQSSITINYEWTTWVHKVVSCYPQACGYVLFATKC